MPNQPQKSDDLFAASYNMSQAHTYDYDDGLLVLPVASDDPDAAPVVVRVHAPLGRRQVRWEASKQGSPPFVPAPLTYEDKDLFLSGAVVVTLPGVQPNRDGWVWKVGGVYNYVQKFPRHFGEDDLQTGGFPFTVGLQMGVRRSLTSSDDPSYAGNTMTAPDQRYLHTDFPAFCFDVGLIG